MKMRDSDQGHQWLQIQATNYGLCNLLSSTRVTSLPTLKGSKGLVALLDMRSLQMNLSCRNQDEAVAMEEIKASERWSQEMIPCPAVKVPSLTSQVHSVQQAHPDLGHVLFQPNIKHGHAT